MFFLNRRDFLKASGMAVAAGFGQGPLERTVQTPVLEIGYVESGNPAGFPVILLHGFPDDVHAYDEVVPPLVRAGHRVLVPYLRGYGTTRFREANTPRPVTVSRRQDETSSRRGRRASRATSPIARRCG